MKKILLFILMIAPIVFYGQSNIPPGPVSGHWDLAGSPYSINGDIYIESAESLTIDPGVQVLFNGWFKLEVFGRLIALGNSASMITFTNNSHYTDIWNGIQFKHTSKNSHMDYCIIENAYSKLGAHAFPESYGGGILCYNSPYGEIKVTNSIIRDNEAYYGGGIANYQSNLILENCTIRNNVAVVGGGVALINNPTTALKKNTIMLNEASKGGGVLLQYSNHDQLECNFIVNNTADLGGGMYMVHSNSGLCKNTIARNMASQDGGGIYFYNLSNPDIYSCNIYFNEDGVKSGSQQIYLANNSNDPSFYHCNILGGMEGFSGAGSATQYSGAYENCVDDDPLFKNMYNGDYSLTWANYPYDDHTKSICIDNGCPDNEPDPDKSCCDIGACCYFQVLEVPDNIYGEELQPQVFMAEWDPSFGALGYEIDVAYDRYFEDVIYDSRNVATNSIKMWLPEPSDMIWFRVRSYNTGLTSDNSQSWALLWVSLDENQADEPNIYASTSAINISIPQAADKNGQAWIYNTSGQLLGHYSLVTGTNTIRLGISKQIVIVKVLLNNKVYQQKLLMH
ncbi:MAG: hypothetical protein V2I47_05950 [Bacteroidales bacterium]|jgi:parallel beta-helix repeat protein|nr:hypothetical protein [Bacteroidales bacterium]